MTLYTTFRETIMQDASGHGHQQTEARFLLQTHYISSNSCCSAFGSEIDYISGRARARTNDFLSDGQGRNLPGDGTSFRCLPGHSAVQCTHDCYLLTYDSLSLLARKLFASASKDNLVVSAGQSHRDLCSVLSSGFIQTSRTVKTKLMLVSQFGAGHPCCPYQGIALSLA